MIIRNSTKKPKGTILINIRHRSNGKIFRPGEKLEYYSIIEADGTCGCKDAKSLYKYYEVKDGVIPIRKAQII